MLCVFIKAADDHDAAVVPFTRPAMSPLPPGSYHLQLGQDQGRCAVLHCQVRCTPIMLKPKENNEAGAVSFFFALMTFLFYLFIELIILVGMAHLLRFRQENIQDRFGW